MVKNKRFLNLGILIVFALAVLAVPANAQQADPCQPGGDVNACAIKLEEAWEVSPANGVYPKPDFKELARVACDKDDNDKPDDDKPEPTKKPENTKQPEPTKKPENTKAPEQTKTHEPKPTKTREVKPTETKKAPRVTETREPQITKTSQPTGTKMAPPEQEQHRAAMIPEEDCLGNVWKGVITSSTGGYIGGITVDGNTTSYGEGGAQSAIVTYPLSQNIGKLVTVQVHFINGSQYQVSATIKGERCGIAVTATPTQKPSKKHTPTVDKFPPTPTVFNDNGGELYSNAVDYGWLVLGTTGIGATLAAAAFFFFRRRF